MVEQDPRQRDVLALRDHFLRHSVLPAEVAERSRVTDLRRLVDFTTSQSPWWKERLAQTKLQNNSVAEIVRTMPILTRDEIQTNFGDLLTRVPGSTDDDYLLQRTSGSTGQPLQIFKYAPIYTRLIDAVTLIEWEWHERDISKTFGLFRLGVEDSDDVQFGPPVSYLGTTGNVFQRASIAHSPDELLSALELHKPTYLLTNPVTWRLVCLEQLQSPKNIGQLEQVLTLADRVDQSLRDLTYEAFGAQIVDRYSSVEFGSIALQCGFAEHLHVVNPNVQVEIVDEDGRECAIGEPGRVLITGLHGYGMPLLRYAQGDIATWGEPCSAGITWPVIADIRGRQRTSVKREDGKEVLVTLFGADFMTIQTILDYRVVKFIDAIVFACQVRSELSPDEERRIADSLQKAFRSAQRVVILAQSDELGHSNDKLQELWVVHRDLPAQITRAEVLSYLNN